MNDELKPSFFNSSFIIPHSSFPLLLLASPDDGLEDFHVAGAAAEIAGEAVADVGLGRLRRSIEQVDGGDDHARRADAALRAAAGDERLLHGVQLLAARDAFDG